MLDNGGLGLYIHGCPPLFTTPDLYINMDISMFSQFIYYKLKNQKKSVSLIIIYSNKLLFVFVFVVFCFVDFYL